MMNEWDPDRRDMVPTEYADQLASRRVRARLAFAGGITFEDRSSSSGPRRSLRQARRHGPLTHGRAMVGRRSAAASIRPDPVYVERFGSSRDEIFVNRPRAQAPLRGRSRTPAGAIASTPTSSAEPGLRS